MSGGTPTGGGLMRQRHSQGYASSGDDLEDDACSSRVRPQSPKFPETRTWVEVLENVLWIASAVFIIYLGDWHSNLIYILFHDGRIKRYVLSYDYVLFYSKLCSVFMLMMMMNLSFVVVNFIAIRFFFFLCNFEFWTLI
ncbi:putative transmembrane protein [Helianthus annuus]|nr:putative transmembrane protein [Helianthus annuus]